MNCLLCGTAIVPGEDTEVVNRTDPCHRECMLRSVLGGIGHLEDHGYWCLQKHDPDGGRSYRQSALEVDAWVHRHGTVGPPV